MSSSGELFMLSREGYVVFIQINTKITLEWAYQQFVASVHTLSYVLNDVTNP